MKYTVVWTEDADAELAEIWVHDNTRTRVTQAVNELERLLRESETARNASGVGKRRILSVDPIGIEFLVEDDDLLVTVTTIWRITNS
jgi:hypothetical protein